MVVLNAFRSVGSCPIVYSPPETQSGRYPGFSLEVFDYIMRLTGLSYTTVQSNTILYGTRTNSSTHPWTGYLGEMYADRYDTVAADFFDLQIRREHFTFTTPYVVSKLFVLVPRTIEAPSFVDTAVHESALLMRMFDTNVWITLVVSLITLFYIIYLSKNYSIAAKCAQLNAAMVTIIFTQIYTVP
jgi:hypothetical protein